MMELTTFVLQSDDVSYFEKNAIVQASYLDDTIKIIRASLDDVKGKRYKSNKKLVPIGSVEFCKAWMNLCDISLPPSYDFPLCFRQMWKVYLNRKVDVCLYSEVPYGMFVKPFNTKEFEPHIIERNVIHYDILRKNPLTWFQEPVKFVAEWRCYIHDKHLLGWTRYDDNDTEYKFFETDIHPFLHMMNAVWGDRKKPISYALDIGMLDNGRIVLVEMNDAWALGFYKGGVSPTQYATMIRSRWNQILGDQ